MVEINSDSLETLQHEVIRLLEPMLYGSGNTATFHHSGGGIFGIQISAGLDSTLFTTLDGRDEPQAWVGLDWSDKDGEQIGYVEVQVRPYKGSHAPSDPPEQIARAIHRMIERIK